MKLGIGVSGPGRANYNHIVRSAFITLHNRTVGQKGLCMAVSKVIRVDEVFG
jgi:hypothetical protein